MTTFRSESPSPANTAAYCALAIAGTTMSTLLFKKLLNEIFFSECGRPNLIAAFTFTSVISIGWFVFVLMMIRIGHRKTNLFLRAQPTESISDTQTASFIRTLCIATIVAFVLAFTAWFSLEINDELFQSRLLPWVL